MTTTTTTLLGAVKTIASASMRAGQSYHTQSLIGATRLTQVEPLCLISSDALTAEVVTDVQQVLLNSFVGYYLRAVSMMAVVDGVQVAKVLDKLAVDRNSDVFLAGLTSAMESYEETLTQHLKGYAFGLPMSGQKIAIEDSDALSDLANNYIDRYIDNVDSAPSEMGGKKAGGSGFDGRVDLAKDLNDQLMENANMGVGKLINVTIKVNDQSATIPVMVKLAVSRVPTSTIEQLLTFKRDTNTLTERFHKWRSGRIEFWRDLVLCEDLIREHKKAMIEDTSGVLQEIQRRANNSKLWGLMTANPSINTASNLVIMTEAVAKGVESKLGGKLANFRTREKAFENTYAMIVVVIDRQMERVIFYHRGIEASTNLSFREIKSASKGKGPDIMDILKAYQLGNGVQF